MANVTNSDDNDNEVIQNYKDGILLLKSKLELANIKIKQYENLLGPIDRLKHISGCEAIRRILQSPRATDKLEIILQEPMAYYDLLKDLVYFTDFRNVENANSTLYYMESLRGAMLAVHLAELKQGEELDLT